MSIRVDGYSIWCDHDDCAEWIGQQQSRSEARASARAAGWERRRMPGRTEDYCPIHRRVNAAVDSYHDAQGAAHYLLADGSWI